MAHAKLGYYVSGIKSGTNCDRCSQIHLSLRYDCQLNAII